jgi:creatinine amidohydrolase
MPWRGNPGKGNSRTLEYERTSPMKFAEMTFPLLRQVPRDRTVVVAPIAACEQHSLHLPTITDTLLVTAVAEGVEGKLADRVLLLPTQWMGASHHHLRFGATLSLDDGYRRILILNGHGGNIDTMQVALRRLQPHYQNAILSAASYWDLASRELATLAEAPRKTMGHACEFETSMVMALRPELVRRDEIRNDPVKEEPVLRGLFLADDMKQKTDHGCAGYPESATPEKGRKFLNAAIERTAEVVTALLARNLPS